MNTNKKYKEIAGFLVIVMTVYLKKMVKWKAAFKSIFPTSCSADALRVRHERKRVKSPMRVRVGGSLTCYKSYNSRSTVTWVYLHHRFIFS